MKTNETTRVQTKATVTAVPTVEERISGSVLTTLFAGSAVIGLWSFAALAGGLVAAGGPIGLAGGYVRAVTGL